MRADDEHERGGGGGAPAATEAEETELPSNKPVPLGAGMIERMTPGFVKEDDVPKRVSAVEFCMMSPNEIRRMGEFEVVNAVLYGTSAQRRTPTADGILDPRLGVCDKVSACGTCGGTLDTCPGHWGFIRLVLPVFNLGYLRHIVQTLQAVCKTCGRVMLDEESRDRFRARMRNPRTDAVTRNALLKAVLAACKKRQAKCPHCGAFNGSVKKVGPTRVVHEKFKLLGKKGLSPEGMDLQRDAREGLEALKGDARVAIERVVEDITPLRALEIFRAMTPEDIEALDMDPTRSHPERFVVTHVPVPPVCIRPTVVSEGATGTTEDDLTVQLMHVASINNDLLQSQGIGKLTTPGLVESWEYLQDQLGLFVNSSLPGLLQKTSQGGGGGGGGPGGGGRKAPPKQIRSLCTRLKGKHGRFRGNLGGKRVDFTARTVISPDPNLFVWEVGVPVHIAKTMTYPERVTPQNIDYLRRLIENGPDVHPGANFVRLADGTKRFLRVNRQRTADNLRLGDIVDRHMRDGDVVLFNRQPSLHRISIMAHRARIFPHRTLRFNESVCTPYNADFDGDEMNLHLPQTEEARAEAAELMDVTRNLVTPRTGEILVASTQDFLTTGYLLTRRDTFYDRAHFMQICVFCCDAKEHVDVPFPALLKPAVLWTGKQAAGIVIRPNRASKVLLNAECASKSYSRSGECLCPNDGWVCFRNSELMCGLLDKATLGGGSKTCIWHVLLRDYSPRIAAEAMTRLAKLSARWITDHGFSIGIADVTPSPQVTKKKAELIQASTLRCQDAIAQFRENRLPCMPGMSPEQSLESVLTKELSDVRENAGKAVSAQLHYNNTPLIMSVCGSKGNSLNISQMIACVGQQVVAGQRIANGFIRRTLPHFPVDSKDAPAKGFVANSFYTGLTPYEFFFHTMCGREGLVDTAVKSVTGDTAVIVLEENVPRWTRIGPWIDARMSARHGEIQLTEQCHLELLPVSGVLVPSMDSCGQMSWRPVTAVTRHDPGDVLYRVETRSGRSVQVPESKSLLVFDETLDRFREVCTPDLQEGDLLPTCASLPAPPVVINSIDVSRYLPPDHECPRPPGHLMLDRANGLFVGIYLAQGECHGPSGLVKVTTTDAIDDSMTKAVQNLFEVFGVEPKVTRKASSAGAPMIEVTGFSHLLAGFLCQFAGHGAEHKFVPDVAFAAPDEFISGLLEGYFAPICEPATPAPERLSEGIAFLCNRNGAFAQRSLADANLGIGAARLHIRGQNGSHSKCDVVLDPVTKITLLSSEGHPKLYDLTVPGTLNFGLANGLQVRDTAETGYMQRRLMKALEDLHIHYDGSVRNSEKVVVQFQYGEDTLDPSFMEAPDRPINFASVLQSVRASVLDTPEEREQDRAEEAEWRAKEEAEEERKRRAREAKKKRQRTSADVDMQGDVEQEAEAEEHARDRDMEEREKELRKIRNVLSEERHAEDGYDESDCRALYPCEIAGRLEHLLTTPPRNQSAPERFRGDISGFLLGATKTEEREGGARVEVLAAKGAVHAIAELRKQYGLDPALEGPPAKPDDPEVAKVASAINGITARQLRVFVTRCYKKYIRAIAEPGTAVGALAGQSIGEPGTQMTLKTFHFAGIASMNVSQGVPRIKEIINATKKIATPIVTAQLVSPRDVAEATAVKGRVERTTLGDIAKSIREVYTPDSCFVSVKVDRDAVLALQLRCDREAIAKAIVEHKQLKKLKIKEKNLLVTEERGSIRFRVTPPMGEREKIFFTMQHLKRWLPTVVVSGIESVSRAVAQKKKNSEDLEILVGGCDLQRVMATPGVVAHQTECNHIITTEKVLGIEAARTKIMREIQQVMGSYAISIDARHLMLVADVMTFKGSILGITRHGISKMKESVLMLASFERMTDFLFEASAHSRVDHIRGVSESIITGTPVHLGTGLFKVLHRVADSQRKTLARTQTILESISRVVDQPVVPGPAPPIPVTEKMIVDT